MARHDTAATSPTTITSGQVKISAITTIASHL